MKCSRGRNVAAADVSLIPPIEEMLYGYDPIATTHGALLALARAVLGLEGEAMQKSAMAILAMLADGTARLACVDGDKGFGFLAADPPAHDETQS
jgi:hypothetical protein